ncbi:hypothetical protein HanPSC8_Chr10g0442921 [Helianthus annuus]|nr:hypothetical protein HanPSC8_Chr10g0442921 [Helianthus annuus]
MVRKVHDVVSIDYTLTPGHWYPVQYDDCFCLVRFFDVEESLSKSLPEFISLICFSMSYFWDFGQI